jgi:hypothetical protein
MVEAVVAGVAAAAAGADTDVGGGVSAVVGTADSLDVAAVEVEPGAATGAEPSIDAVSEGRIVEDGCRAAPTWPAQPAPNTVTAAAATTRANRFERPMSVATLQPALSLQLTETHSSGEPLVV